MSIEKMIFVTTEDSFLTARQVMDRYGGISQMTLWRWLHDDQMAFPQPVYISRYRYWRLADIEDWDAKIAANQAPSPIANEAENRKLRDALERIANSNPRDQDMFELPSIARAALQSGGQENG